MDFLNSFFQNIKDKLTSPFFGTLTVILIIHHWEFWYTLFNFDKDCTRTEKVATLRLIANAEFGGWNFFQDIITAVIIMLIGYGIVMATRTLSLTIDFRFMPWITGKVINKKVVERSVHEDVVKERDEYSEKYEDQRKAVRILSKDYDTQALQIQTKNESITSQQLLISNLQKSNSELESNLNDERSLSRGIKTEKDNLSIDYQITKASLLEVEKQVEVLQENQNNLMKLLLNPDIMSKKPASIPLEISIRAEELKASGDWIDFINYADFEHNGGSISGKTITRMQELGLANKDNYERMTPLGRYLSAYANSIT